MQISKEQQGEIRSLPQQSMQRNRGKQQNGNNRDLFNKIRDISSIKDRNGMDLTEAEDIKKRWKEYTEELYKKRSS